MYMVIAKVSIYTKVYIRRFKKYTIHLASSVNKNGNSKQRFVISKIRVTIFKTELTKLNTIVTRSHKPKS